MRHQKWVSMCFLFQGHKIPRKYKAMVSDRGNKNDIQGSTIVRYNHSDQIRIITQVGGKCTLHLDLTTLVVDFLIPV